MQVETQLSHCSGEVSKAARQVVDAVGGALAELAAPLPVFEGFDRLVLMFSLSHPIMVQGVRKPSGSYVAAHHMFIASASLGYAPWTGTDWSARVEEVGRAMTAAVGAVHKTRIAAAERETLLTLIPRAVAAAQANPPASRIDPRPIYLIFAGGPGGERQISFGRPIIAPSPADHVVVVPPAEAMAHSAAPPAATPQMFKLYRREPGPLAYWEAWPATGSVVEHRGVCGEKGLAREHPAQDPPAQIAVLQRLAGAAKAEGYRAAPRHVGLLVQRAVDGFGTSAELDERHALEAFLDEQLGWLGLGHCDGGSIGSGSMEAFCYVVDYGLAEAVLSRELAASRFAAFRVTRA